MDKREAKEKLSAKKSGGKKPKPPTEGPKPKDQINLTDEESRIMPTSGGGFDQAYNAQASVEHDSRLIVHQHVTQNANDKLEIEPTIKWFTQHPELKPPSLLADAGYFSEANIKQCAKEKITSYIQYKLNSGMFFEKEIIPTLDEFAPTSFEVHKHERRELTRMNYQRVYDLHLKPYFGTTRLDKIKSFDVAKWQNRLLETRSGKTVKSIRTVFQTILEDAMIDELIKTNPFVRVKSPRMDEVREKKPFNKEEIFKIIGEMPESMQCFFTIGFFTGMRTGELIGLK